MRDLLKNYRVATRDFEENTPRNLFVWKGEISGIRLNSLENQLETHRIDRKRLMGPGAKLREGKGFNAPLLARSENRSFI